MKLPWLWFLVSLTLLLLGMLAVAWYNGRFSTFGVRFPAAYAIQGFDVSRHQGEIDWQKVASTMEAGRSMHFVFIKATEGADLVDAQFEANWQAAGQCGMLRGAYHYFHPKTNTRKQADFFLSVLKKEEMELPAVIDIETANSLSAETVADSLNAFLKYLEPKLLFKPIIYTGQRFYEKILNGKIEAYPLWIARYGIEEPQLQPGANWVFWQFTDQGRLPGIPEKVDFNVFNGNETDWNRWVEKH